METRTSNEYFVRYIYDADDDGLVASQDYDDNESSITNDCDGDGYSRILDCNDKMRVLVGIVMEMD